ncbi:MAG: ABC transporter permease subunit, partial [Bacilli bacterium]
QTEAARSLGLSKMKTMIKVILPQAIRNILPAIGNEYVTIIKETSLAMTFFVGDLMTIQKEIGSVTYLYLEAYIAVGIFYFISTFTLSKLILAMERRMKRSVGYS